MSKKKLSAVLAIFMMGALTLGACGSKDATPSPSPTAEQTQQTQEATPADSASDSDSMEASMIPEETGNAEDIVVGDIQSSYTGTTRIAALKGPTGIGLAKLMTDAKAQTTKNPYEITLVDSPEEIVGLVSTGAVEIAALPTNLAASLNVKTNNSVQVLAINTLGVLQIVEVGDSVKSMSDLSGKTLHATGQGSTPQYVLEYLLEAYGATDCQIEWHADHAELAALVASGDVTLAMLPEPFVTTVLNKNDKARSAVDLASAWDEKNTDSKLSMGCLIVNRDFAKNNKEVVDTFLDEYKQSIDFAVTSPEEAGVLVQEVGIMPSAAIATQAIPRCNLVYIDGEEMKTMLGGFYQVLFDLDSRSVGGELPNDSFYYQK